MTEPVCVCDDEGPVPFCDVHGTPSAAYEHGLADGALSEALRPAFNALADDVAAEPVEYPMFGGKYHDYFEKVARELVNVDTGKVEIHIAWEPKPTPS